MSVYPKCSRGSHFMNVNGQREPKRRNTVYSYWRSSQVACVRLVATCSRTRDSRARRRAPEAHLAGACANVGRPGHGAACEQRVSRNGQVPAAHNARAAPAPARERVARRVNVATSERRIAVGRWPQCRAARPVHLCTCTCTLQQAVPAREMQVHQWSARARARGHFSIEVASTSISRAFTSRRQCACTAQQTLT